MFEIRDNIISVYVMDEIMHELADRVRAEKGSRLHQSLTTGGVLEPRDVQLVASVVPAQGDGLEVPLKQSVTPMLAQVIHVCAQAGRKLRVEAH